LSGGGIVNFNIISLCHSEGTEESYNGLHQLNFFVSKKILRFSQDDTLRQFCFAKRTSNARPYVILHFAFPKPPLEQGRGTAGVLKPLFSRLGVLLSGGGIVNFNIISLCHSEGTEESFNGLHQLNFFVSKKILRFSQDDTLRQFCIPSASLRVREGDRRGPQAAL